MIDWSPTREEPLYSFDEVLANRTTDTTIGDLDDLLR